MNEIATLLIYIYIYVYIFSEAQRVPLVFIYNKQIFPLYIYIPLPLVRLQMSTSGSSYHWGIRLGTQRKKLIAAKSGLRYVKTLKSGLKSLYVALGRLAKLVSYTFVFLSRTGHMMRVGLVKPWFA